MTDKEINIIIDNGCCDIISYINQFYEEFNNKYRKLQEKLYEFKKKENEAIQDLEPDFDIQYNLRNNLYSSVRSLSNNLKSIYIGIIPSELSININFIK